jgi:hypothetical protein
VAVLVELTFYQTRLKNELMKQVRLTKTEQQLTTATATAKNKNKTQSIKTKNTILPFRGISFLLVVVIRVILTWRSGVSRSVQFGSVRFGSMLSCLCFSGVFFARVVVVVVVVWWWWAVFVGALAVSATRTRATHAPCASLGCTQQ